MNQFWLTLIAYAGGLLLLSLTLESSHSARYYDPLNIRGLSYEAKERHFERAYPVRLGLLIFLLFCFINHCLNGSLS